MVTIPGVGCYELARVSRMILLRRKETNGLLEKMEDVSGSFFQNMKILPNDVSNFKIEGMKS